MAFDPYNQSHFKGSTCFVAEALPDVLEIVNQAPSVPFWARGEPKEYDSPCLPAIARDDHEFVDREPHFEKGGLMRGEVEALNRCLADFLSGDIADDLFSRFFSPLFDQIDFTKNELLYWASLAQHHNHEQRYPTRLLDVTSDILVATYFACVTHDTEDGYVFYGSFSCNDLSKCGEVVAQDSFFDIVEIEDVDNPTDPYTNSMDTLCLAPMPYPNRHMTAQRGAFVWSRNPMKGYFNEMRQLTIKIPRQRKSEFIVHLDRLGYNHTNIFPDQFPAESSIYRLPVGR